MSDETDRYCVSCRNLVGRRTYLDTSEDWSCHAKENVISFSRNLVTGGTVYHLRYSTCYDARSSDDGCGSIGKWWELYEPFMPKVVGGAKMTAENLLAELEGKDE